MKYTSFGWMNDETYKKYAEAERERAERWRQYQIEVLEKQIKKLKGE